MSDLIATAKPKKKRNKTKSVEKKQFAGSSCSCCTSGAQGAAQGQVEYRPQEAQKLRRVSQPVLPTLRARLGAEHPKPPSAFPNPSFRPHGRSTGRCSITILNKSYGEHLKHDVSIEKIASMSLIIQGWALADFGQGALASPPFSLSLFFSLSPPPSLFLSLFFSSYLLARSPRRRES